MSILLSSYIESPSSTTLPETPQLTTLHRAPVYISPLPFWYSSGVLLPYTVHEFMKTLQSPREALLVYIAMRRAGVHGFSMKYGMKNDMYCVSGLISSYSKGGKFDMAQKVFCSSPVRKVGHWNAIIAGPSQGGCGREALNMFVEMMKSGICPDDMTMVCVTSACGSLGDLNLALQLHKFIFQVNRLEKQDVLTMNSVIDICMVEAGITPNHVTFVGLLTACVHGGMVQEGKYYFNMMKNGYGIEPMLPHYGCMVDLLGRAGEHVAKHLIELEPGNSGVHVVLSNIYANSGVEEEITVYWRSYTTLRLFHCYGQPLLISKACLQVLNYEVAGFGYLNKATEYKLLDEYQRGSDQNMLPPF
ncbi:hypothetical protein SASPL_114067 [Salvia splendens]|uniref:Pentatricopeptide repeat domain-containing protein 1 n=1 Tax=Salvia splendens TaxID=180675 RepID=A0A8X8Y4W1_SALSN|nr:hypothetical protein SASPL_114067 [Salvia splendens]